MSDYCVGLLTPTRVEGGDARNAELLGPLTLGIEVTEAELAVRCGLGVIDPQHGGAGSGAACIEAALDWPLPPAAATLATIRPDADAFGAMAVLSLRAKSAPLSSALIERVRFVARHDSFSRGGWRDFVAGRTALVHPAAAAEVSFFPLEYRALSALARDESCWPLKRMEAFEHWLSSGEIPSDMLLAADIFAKNLADAYNSGAIEIDEVLPSRLAVLRGNSPGCLPLAYRVAPVVAAFVANAPPRKITIAQFEAGHVDLTAVSRALAELEPGWGGSANIIGSPQGVGSYLAEGVVLATLIAHLSGAELPCVESRVDG
jgi:hypothetical protein